MAFFAPVETFRGHFDTFPPASVLLWNTFVPKSTDLTTDFLGAVLVMRDRYFPPAAAPPSAEEAAARAEAFRRLDVYFSFTCESGEFDLVPNGREIAVSAENFLDYVRRVEELYSAFAQRSVAFCVLEDQPDGLVPLVPASAVDTTAGAAGSFGLVRQLTSGVGMPPSIVWVPPSPIDFTSELPLALLPRAPAGAPVTGTGRYTPVFLFCHLGDCVVCRCAGWATLREAAAFQHSIRRQAHAAATASSTGGGGSPSIHINTIRQLREGGGGHPQQQQQQLMDDGASGGATAPLQMSVSSRSTREEQERVKSQYMRDNAVPIPSTAAERALFSPTHELTDLFAPIQALQPVSTPRLSSSVAHAPLSANG